MEWNVACVGDHAGIPRSGRDMDKQTEGVGAVIAGCLGRGSAVVVRSEFAADNRQHGFPADIHYVAFLCPHRWL